MSSASEGSGTRRRMKLRNRDRCSATISEIRRSCSVIEMMPDRSFIQFGRRTAGGNIVEMESAKLGWAPSLHRAWAPLDKSEGVVKTEISWAVREHRFLCQRRLRTKTLEISR